MREDGWVLNQVSDQRYVLTYPPHLNSPALQPIA